MSRADCPSDWFCRPDPASAELRCFDTPQCVGAETCDDGLSCTVDGCDLAEGRCTHVLPEWACVVEGGCLDCRDMTLPECGAPRCESGACVARPRMDLAVCGLASCDGPAARKEAPVCDGETTVCEPSAVSTPCPREECEVGRCDAGGDAACYARAELSNRCALDGLWWVVWYAPLGCRQGCAQGEVVGGLGELDVDDAGVGIYRGLGGARWSGIHLDKPEGDARVTWAEPNQTPDWTGRVVASGDVMVGSHRVDGGFVWMLKTDPSEPPTRSMLEGRWRLILLSSGFEHLFRLHGGELRYDAEGCLTDAGAGIWPDPLHPFGAMQPAIGACAIEDGAYLSLPIQHIAGVDEQPRLKGTLSRDGGLGVFAQEALGQWTGEVALLVRLPEDTLAPPPLRGSHVFFRTAQTERASTAPRPPDGPRVLPLSGTAVFDGQGRGTATGAGDLGDGEAVHDFVNTRVTARPGGSYSLWVQGATGGFAMEAWPVPGRVGWPAPGLMIGHGILEGSSISPRPGDPHPDDAPADANLTVWVWDDDLSLDAPTR